MTDQPEPTEDTRSLTVVKERLIAHSQEPIWDSAAFDHMGRVAAVMAESGLCSDTLLNDDAGNPANPKTIVARMLLVAHMARECGANPLMFLQGCSRIGKKIHLEGKLVNAIVRARTGVNLRFEFGRWETDHIELPELHEDGPLKGQPVDPKFFHGLGERLAVRVSDPDDPERHVEGSVGLWKTDRRGSPWASQGNWRRQLRYRGAPEWARAYEPGAVLGIYSEADEDLDDAPEPKPVGLMQRLKGTQEGDGFDNEAVQEQTAPKRRGRPPKAKDEPEETMHADEPVKETAEIERVEAVASGNEPEVNTSHAAPGVVYILEGDGYNNDGRRMTYKDGQRFSTVHRDTEHKYEMYAVHAPELKADEPSNQGENLNTDIPEHMRDDVGGSSIETLEAELSGIEPYQEGEDVPEGILERPTETAGVPTAEPEPATSGTVHPASNDGAPQVEASGRSQPQDAASPLDDYGDKLEACGEWADVLPVMREFFNGEFFLGLAPERQNAIRGRTWINLKDMGNFKMPDVGEDVSAFRLWIESDSDAEAISETFDFLQKGDRWKALGDANRNNVSLAVAARLKALGG